MKNREHRELLFTAENAENTENCFLTAENAENAEFFGGTARAIRHWNRGVSQP